MARLIITHSSYIEGLIPLLKRMANNNEIKSIIPGRIQRTKGRNEALKLKVSINTNEGYKIIARKGSSVQEVFIITKLTKENVEEIIIKLCNQKKNKL